MKKFKLKNGFTLIELLVVIVIIGILSTIGIATFQGYFAQARDTERLTVIRSIERMIKADQIQNDQVDYYLGGTDAATIETAAKKVFTDQGYSIPSAKQGISYYYVVAGIGVIPVIENFVVFACKESSLGDTSGSNASDVAFIAGTSLGISSVTESVAETACVSDPIAPVIPFGLVINLD